jgi:DNA invertase Pin-like site-specific DNA recombinase
MLKRLFDPKKSYRVVLYLRMSDDHQNPRSPDQQRAEIERVMRAVGYNWTIVKVFRDDAKTGRLLRNRRQYQQMMSEIRSGALKVDLILVDTIERFGRVDELPAIRKDLDENHGVLVLTANTGFADPTTSSGRALGAVEAIRASEDGRAKGHNVLRGKRDAVLQKHWPGGKPPFGLMLRSVFKTEHGREVLDYCTIVPNPVTSWIIKALKERAAETAHGTIRLTKWLDDHPDIPATYKPFHPQTVGRWLDETLYEGDFVFLRYATGIIGDAIVRQKNPEAELIKITDFCEQITSRELGARVRALRRIRRQAHPGNKPAHDEKLIAPLVKGLTVKYLLSGLLVCECGLKMTASSSAVYVDKSGKRRRYVNYVCPSNVAGNCPNNLRIPEPWIRQVVITALRELLFPTATG